MSNQHRIPTYMKISDFYVAQAKELKILGSFVASNICRDTEGALRIPEPFLSEFGRIMPYFLQLRFDDIMWHAYFEKEEKKVCGTYDLFRYYDLRMYSFVIFDYIGKGIFKVKGYTTNAIEVQKPEIDVAQFYKNFEPSQLRFDEFVYGRNHLQIERYIAMSTMAGTNQSVDMWKIEIEGISNIAEDAHLELKPELENLYKGWEGKHHIHLCPGVNFWEISVTLVDGDELAAEKKAEEKNGKRSFYKIIVESVLEEGYLVLPPMLGEETEKNLLAVRKLKLEELKYEEAFVYEEKNPNGHPDSAHERINTIVKQAPLPKNAVNMPDLVDIDSEPEVEVVDAPQEEEQAADMEIEDEAQVMQFSKNLNASNMNGRCHGMHIPPEIRLPNKEWQHGDDHLACIEKFNVVRQDPIPPAASYIPATVDDIEEEVMENAANQELVHTM
ncbi:hypothetical protein POM88_051886 [Heracleum sosnowskyi]|uniref:Uncharacterized protein n=1 Tax=Heracleum sosnowskyi TaxID=360622 RepID=A0AAD8LY54_9APIA|nr:hypothetical protein POM88_051886 [Heracleum sosnowskyi]